MATASKTTGRTAKKAAAKKTAKRASANTSVKRILNCEPSPNRERDWIFENAAAAGILAAAPDRIPGSIDLRAAWWKIGDQGATGSCVGWASADSVLRWHFASTGRISQNDLLSVRFAWMAPKEIDVFASAPTTFIEAEGTSLKAALDVARKLGAVAATVLPFASGKLYSGDAKTFYAIAAKLKIQSYFNLGTNQTDWRAWLANNGPILTRLNVDATWDKATDNDGKLTTYKSNTKRGGHAVALVGYTPRHFIVRNSWGTDWGDKGFAYASNAYAKAAFTEAYGVVIA